MTERIAIIASSAGLHARPAAALIETAKAQSVPITVALEGGVAVNAASLLSVLTLGGKQGDRLVLRAEGDGAEDALEAVAAVIETDYDA